MRYFRSKKSHSAVNIISLISVSGIVVTTAALICVLSVFNGFRTLIMDRLALLDPEIAVMPVQGKVISSADSIVYVIKATEGVESAVAVIEEQALAVFAGYQMPVRIKGIPEGYNEVSCLDSVIVEGSSVMNDGVSEYAVIGVGPAINLHVRPGFLQMLQIYAPRREGTVNMSNPMGAFVVDSLFVGGIFQLQQVKYDSDLIYVPIDFARKLFDYPVEASRVEVSVAPGADVAKVMEAISSLLGTDYAVKNRLMQQASAYRLVNVEKWMSFLLLTFILIIATFNVISSLSLLIIEKDESIATLRWLGATENQVKGIFAWESWIITAVGTILGILLGLCLCLGQKHFGWISLGGDPATLIVNAYPVEIQATDVLVVLGLAMLIGFVTSLVTRAIVSRRTPWEMKKT